MADLGAERPCPACGKHVVPNANTGHTPGHWRGWDKGKRCPGGQVYGPRPLRRVVGDIHVCVRLAEATISIPHEHLECGHTFTHSTDKFGNRTFPGKRRCRTCPRNDIKETK